ncbi:hypothetical protein BY458DRAFT_520106 [Sporodiniella umbellata]|nr:hypothetical protein BY458DRAFT_520106 [Sporodiniella umbellata]
MIEKEAVLFPTEFDFQQEWNDPTICDLRDVIVYYQTEPELLKLILESKVQEDRRKGEEARMRAKELDLILLDRMMTHDPSTWLEINHSLKPTPRKKNKGNKAMADLTQAQLLKSRRRREMQAITKIVQTRDSPYNDGFFWKNNGNTVQKKTGYKSIYYKCSNSTKGCPVNKTVTAKENGDYLIKYRGEHLSACGKVQRRV